MKFPVLIPNIFDHPFTYTSDINLNVGDYVEVPFGKKFLVYQNLIMHSKKTKIYQLKIIGV